MDLNTLANIAEIVAAAIVLGGVGFAFVELSQLRQQRRDTAAIELSRSFQTPEFSRSLRLVLELPEGVTRAQLAQMEPEYEEAAMLVSLTLESVGIIVNRNVIPGDPQRPDVTSGIRVGSPGITARGMGENEVNQIVELMDTAMVNAENGDILDQVAQRVAELCRNFPVYK